jgi:hypothetical protein
MHGIVINTSETDEEDLDLDYHSPIRCPTRGDSYPSAEGDNNIPRDDRDRNYDEKTAPCTVRHQDRSGEKIVMTDNESDDFILEDWRRRRDRRTEKGTAKRGRKRSKHIINGSEGKPTWAKAKATDNRAIVRKQKGWGL